MEKVENKDRSFLSIILELSKIRITILVTVTSAVGYVLSNGHIDLGIIAPVLGVFILSCGSSAFNHIQEHKYDKLMNRTKNRPIPAGLISPNVSFAIASILVLLGLFIITLSENMQALLLGLLAVFWYNIFYTPMKRVTSMAVVPGALVGSIPPLIGWVAGGGSLIDPSIWGLALFIFIWQIPHFWLLLLIYDKDYKEANYPVLTDLISHYQLRRISFVWIVALLASYMLIPFIGFSDSIIINGIILLAGIKMVWNTKDLLKEEFEYSLFKKSFMEINVFVVIVLLLISIEKLFGI